MAYWHDKTAVITGGGRGFGKAFGVALAARGAHSVLVDVDAAAAEDAAASIRATGGSAQGMVGDVTDELRIGQIMAQAAEAQGGIDLLINNAGLHSDAYSRQITEMGAAAVRRLFDVNVNGVLTCTLAALPFMKGRRGASIVNISSAAAFTGGTAYGSSKLAVAGLTIAFAKELGPLGIRVNAVAPGLILTETIAREPRPHCCPSRSHDATDPRSDVTGSSGSSSRVDRPSLNLPIKAFHLRFRQASP